MGRSLLIGLAVTFVAVVAPAGAGAAARPDTSLDGNGFVTTKVKGASVLAYGAAVTGDGRIVAAGQAIGAKEDEQVLVARYRQNGRRDRDFASGGIFTSSLPKKDGPFIATSVVEDSTGKLLVAGGYGQGSMLVLRLTSKGKLDRSFGGDPAGIAKAEVGGIAQSIALQPDGSVVLGGSNANTNGRPMVVAHFTEDGALDPTFGTDGIASVMFWDPTLAASAGADITAASDGSLTGFGHLDYIGSDGHGSAGVFRLTADGQPDAGFGTAGNVEVAFTSAAGGFAQWFPCGFGVDSQGRTTVTGDGSTGSGDQILTTRLTAAGVPDPSYGASGDGRAVTPGAKGDNNTTCGATVTAAGVLTVGVGPKLAQLGADGSPNTAFASGGVLDVAKPKGVTINAVEPSPKRRIVLAGSAGKAIYVGRYRLPPKD